MAINFPDSPTVGQDYTSGTTTWTWDGVKWALKSNQASTNDSMPVGSIMWFAGSVTPNAWLPANGAAVSRTTYATLFAAISTTYGSGDGSTTFNVPSVAATTGAYYIRYTTSVGTVTTTSLSTAPVGTIINWPVTSSYPTGWLRADGSAVSRTSYADLFSLIGSTYGSGDGSTTFNLPSLVASGSGSPVSIIKASLGGLVEPSTVAHASSHTQGGSDVVSVTLNQVPNYQSNRNIVINGSFDVWQRGTSFASGSITSPYYTVDRWITARLGLASGATYSRQTSDLTGYNYFIRCQRDSGNTGTGGIYLDTSFETINVRRLQGKYVTLSFWAKAGANYSATSGALNAQVWYGTGTDGNYAITGFTSAVSAIASTANLSTSWVRYSFTSSSVLPTNATQLAVRFFGNPVGTAGTNDYYDITGVQLEEGTVMTPFEFEPVDIILRKCQRYYERTDYPSGLNYGYVWCGNTTSGGIYYIQPSYKVTKRSNANPTILTSSTQSFGTPTVNTAGNGANYCLIQGIANATASASFYQIQLAAEAEL